MPVALKATFTVQAGIIPGEPMLELTKVWPYTSLDEEADRKLPPMPEGHVIDLGGSLEQPHINRYTRMLMESTRYAQSLTNPARMNWVRHEWMWV